MNTAKNLFFIITTVFISILFAAVSGCAGGKKAAVEEQTEVITTNIGGKGIAITVEFTKGKSHNHPLMVIWLEDLEGEYIETLYVAESIGKGIFRHGEKSKGQWMPGPIRRPAALPYWGHKRGVEAPDGYFIPTPEEPMPDAITGATPQGNFILQSKSTETITGPFKLMMEINQSWDWNEYWTNNKFPDDIHYSTSSQPAVVYEAVIDPAGDQKTYVMKPIGHSHYSGKDGSLNPDLSTLTTALEIVRNAMVVLM